MNESERYLSELAQWRTDRDEFFAHHYATPLSDETLADFAGLRYFPGDPAWVVVGVMELNTAPVEIESSTGAVSAYPGAGTVTFDLPEGSFRMQVLYGEEDELFIPFRDRTSGVATYGGGRYADAQPQDGSLLVADFNRAINPYCAYDPDFSCPLPPRQNWLPFAVEAGELAFPYLDE